MSKATLQVEKFRPSVQSLYFVLGSKSCIYLQVWYANFLKDCPSGELSEKKFIQVYVLLAKIFPGYHFLCKLMMLIKVLKQSFDGSRSQGQGQG